MRIVKRAWTFSQYALPLALILSAPELAAASAFQTSLTEVRLAYLDPGTGSFLIQAVVAAIAGMNELNIGHSIVARAIMVGFQQAVREMKDLVS